MYSGPTAGLNVRGRGGAVGGGERDVGGTKQALSKRGKGAFLRAQQHKPCEHFAAFLHVGLLGPGALTVVGSPHCRRSSYHNGR